MKTTLLNLCIILITAITANADPAVPGSNPDVFRIVKNGKSIPIVYDINDAEVVGICAKALADDIALITDVSPRLETILKKDAGSAIIAGTLGKSKLIDSLIRAGKLSAKAIEGKWESFAIQVVDSPVPGMDNALVITGSDPRGTAFGIFDLSKRMGVSPWVYWADVKPAKRKDLSVSIDRIVMGPPSVKYRGIFLNDEDWGLKPWAANNLDTDIKDIGPRTYSRIFELLLRLKANYIWPAMHPCTKAFFYYPENPKVAAKYGIILGSSHCEPMLRNNVDEWKNNFQGEYTESPGPWRYDKNKKQIYRYWEDRVKQVNGGKIEAVFTVGMRGIHDSGLPGPKTIHGKIDLMEKVIGDQRGILSKHLNRNITDISQIFCPYKEVLHIYNAGVRIPDDVTIVWADDNHGYIRKLSTPKEQRRTGGSGIYYHLSYWGAPEDYLWLCSTSPSLISYEMTKAYTYGADRLWVFNAGDIKPAEMEIEFAMDLAWNIGSWPPEKAEEYLEEWAGRNFGKEFAEEISNIKTVYYKLASSGKPEHIDKIRFSEKEMNTRLKDYGDITKRAENLKTIIPEHLQDAYFQLVLYPVLGAAKMNEKHFYARTGDNVKSKYAYNEIRRLTHIYNNRIANGKWKNMMNMSPRGRQVFKVPEIGSDVQDSPGPLKPIKTIFVTDLDYDKEELHLIPGLGASGISLSRIRFDGPSYSNPEPGILPSASIKINLPEGKRIIELVCVPTHAIHEGRSLRTGISLGGDTYRIVNVNSLSKTKTWSENVIRGYSLARTSFNLNESGPVDLHLSILDPGLAISKINIY